MWLGNVSTLRRLAHGVSVKAIYHGSAQPKKRVQCGAIRSVPSRATETVPQRIFSRTWLREPLQVVQCRFAAVDIHCIGVVVEPILNCLRNGTVLHSEMRRSEPVVR